MQKITPNRIAILGATGPTGKSLARELTQRGAQVRVVSRNLEHLNRAFPGASIEKQAGDICAAGDVRRVIEGCDLVVDCIGLPADRLGDHPLTARNITQAAVAAGARIVQVSSYWAYLPVQQLPVSEDHPRTDGVYAVQMRREAEDILQEAGAAVVNLPDFYGPEVHTSVLQNALREAAAWKTVNWIGASTTPREHVYVPDAMTAVAELSLHEEAYGKRWIVPGAGVITLEGIVRIVEDHLKRRIEVRAAGRWMLRLASLFSAPLRQFAPMLPYYLEEVRFDGSRLRGLIGDVPKTSYDKGICATLDWITR